MAAQSIRRHHESRTRQYELVYIVTPEASEQEIADLHTQIEQIVQRFNGTFDKTENWGRRKLAYDIGHHREGTYVVETITGSGELMKEIDRRLRVIDTVIRHLIVRVDEELRVARAARATRARRSQARRRVARGLPPEPQPGERRGDGDCRRGRRSDGRRGGPAMSEERGGGGRGRGRTRRTTRARAKRARAADSSAGAASASSARRRSTTSTTRTCGCWRRSCPSAARFSRAGSRARARCTSASCRPRSSARASWR